MLAGSFFKVKQNVSCTVQLCVFDLQYPPVISVTLGGRMWSTHKSSYTECHLAATPPPPNPCPPAPTHTLTQDNRLSQCSRHREQKGCNMTMECTQILSYPSIRCQPGIQPDTPQCPVCVRAHFDMLQATRITKLSGGKKSVAQLFISENQ